MSDLPGGRAAHRRAAAATAGTPVFIVLLAAGSNLWVGMRRAGHALSDEVPIYADLCPAAAVAVFARFRRLHAS